MDKRRKNKLIMVMEIIVNICGMAAIFLAVWFIFYRYNLMTHFLYKKGTAILVFIYSILFLVFNQIYNGYKIDYLRTAEIIYSQFLSMLFVNVIAFLQICLIDRRVVEAYPMVILSALETIFIVWWAVWSKKRYKKRNIIRNLSIIYKDMEPYDVAEKLRHYENKFNIAEFIKCGSNSDEIISGLSRQNGVVLCGIDPAVRKPIIDFCFENKMPIFVVPDSTEIILRSSDILSIQDMPLFQCHKGELSMIDEAVKRLFDICVSLAGILVLWPVMLITAVIIKASDGGPVLYKQNRLTIHGNIFEVYKFRSMVVNAEKDGVARLAKESDSRVTRVGAVIRKYRIDELPQLFNILKGDISVVGPRPERPEIAKQYEKTIPEFKYRLKVKAGLTGYAQVLGRYNTTPYNKLMWDLMYIEGYSFMMDLKIILMTIKILFLPESTQGIDEGFVTADKSEGVSR